MPTSVISSRSRARLFAQTDEKNGLFSDEVQQEARDVLEKVGWASPTEGAELTSEDPFVKQINAGIQRDFGVDLDDLLNPAKVGIPVSNYGCYCSKRLSQRSDLANAYLYRLSIWNGICITCELNWRKLLA